MIADGSRNKVGVHRRPSAAADNPGPQKSETRRRVSDTADANVWWGEARQALSKENAEKLKR
jgi:hypothetical protein